MANGLVEVERPRSDDITSTQDHDRFVGTGIDDLPMTRGDLALMAALQHRMRGDQSAILKDPNLTGERMHFDDRFRVASGTL